MRLIHLQQKWYSLSDPAMEEALMKLPSVTKKKKRKGNPQIHQTKKSNQRYHRYAEGCA